MLDFIEVSVRSTAVFAVEHPFMFIVIVLVVLLFAAMCMPVSKSDPRL